MQEQASNILVYMGIFAVVVGLFMWWFYARTLPLMRMRTAETKAKVKAEVKAQALAARKKKVTAICDDIIDETTRIEIFQQLHESLKTMRRKKEDFVNTYNDFAKGDRGGFNRAFVTMQVYTYEAIDHSRNAQKHFERIKNHDAKMVKKVNFLLSNDWGEYSGIFVVLDAFSDICEDNLKERCDLNKKVIGPLFYRVSSMQNALDEFEKNNGVISKRTLSLIEEAFKTPA